MDLPPPRSWQRPTDLPAPGGYPPLPVEPEEKRRGGGSGWLIGVMLLSLAAVIAIILITRNSSNDSSTKATTATPTATEPVASSAPATTAAVETVAPTTEAPAPTTVAPAPTTVEATTTLPPETTTTVAVGLPGDLEVVVAAADGSHLVTTAGDSILLPKAASRSFRAFDGSIIFQETSGQLGGGSSESTHIQRVAPGGEAVIVAAESGEFLQLHDVDAGDGSDIIVLYSIAEGTTPEDSAEGLYRLDLLSGSTTYLGDIGGWESGTGPLHLAGELVIGEASAEASTSMLALDLRGNPVDVTTGLGLEAVYSDCGDCPHNYSIDPTGATIAWTENSTLVVADRSGATPAKRFDIPGLVPTAGADVQIEGGVVILNRDGAPALIVDIRSGTPIIGELTLAGLATFA